MDPLSDQQIVTAVTDGDTEAYSVLVDRYQRPIFNLMYRMTRSHADAHDLAQETFIKAFEQLRRFNTDRRFFPWLYTIGLNHARNFLRKEKAMGVSFNGGDEEGYLQDHPSGTEEAMCARLELKQVERALGQIPWDYREAIMLHFHEGFTMEEIASTLQLSVSGAKMRIHRGLEKLRGVIFGDHHEREEKNPG